MVGPIIRRPRARTSASIAPAKRRCSATPSSRYRISPRAYPEALPPIEYAPGDQVRKVQHEGEIHFRGRTVRIGKAFRGYPVAVRPTVTDGVWTVSCCRQWIAQVDLRDPLHR
jgi:hypothetical protein